jgi:FkbM family methyltransferase
MATPTVSYAQRFEDLYLMRCFAGDSDGFYIDIGSGHPVYDNTSFAFYLKGWHGITVEPNPWLARLSRAVRPRDRHVEALVAAAVGEATFYLVNDLHGLSTKIESHARAAQTQFGKSSQAIAVPVTTLKDLCRQHAPPAFDFLKVDVRRSAGLSFLRLAARTNRALPHHSSSGYWGGVTFLDDETLLPRSWVREWF